MTCSWDRLSAWRLLLFSRVDHSQRPCGRFFLQLDCQNLAFASQVATSVAHTALYQLQLYWIDTQLRGPPSFSQGPQWRSQVRRGRTSATQARQKITGFGKFGIGYLIHPGSGKREHLRLSAQLYPLAVCLVMLTTIQNLWPSVKPSWGHTDVLFGRRKL